MTHHAHDTISGDFYRFGLDGLGLNRAAERRAVERDRNRASAILRAPRRPSSARRSLGMALIAVGSWIAGTMPMPNLDPAYRRVGT